MRTFAFIPGQMTKTYSWIISKYKRHNTVVDFIKVWALVFGIFVCWLFYLYYVSLSSTRWYFLKQANQEMTSINFQYEILKTQFLEYKQLNRNTVQSSSFKRDVVDVSAEIVKIPDNIQLGFVSSQDLIN